MTSRRDATPRSGDGRRVGFTLLELLFVVVILGVLAAVLIPRLTGSAASAKRSACARNVAEINAQVELWYFRKGTWPKPDLSDIGSDTSYFPDGVPACPVDGSAYTLDASTHRVTGHGHKLGVVQPQPMP